MDDPRLSDDATGLSPMDEIGDDEAMLVLAWSTGDGLVQSPFTDAVEPCRYLHLRGLVIMEGTTASPQWGQVHIAIPSEAAMDVAVALTGGSLTDDPT